jgi:ribosome-associated protein
MPRHEETEAITQKKPAVRKRATAKSSAERLPSDLLKIVEKSLDADKAEDIISIDLAGKSSIADYMVIATGRSNRQLASMAQHLDEKLTKTGIKKVSIEGLTQGEWVLLDGGDVIVHLFKPDTRRFYNLEKMWGVELPEPERMTALA